MTTIDHLLALRPGERVVYYRGDFGADIEASQPGKAMYSFHNERRRTTTRYRNILCDLRETAQNLADVGRVHLVEEPEHIRIGEQTTSITRYIAIGVRP
jgi:hypothetical protein